MRWERLSRLAASLLGRGIVSFRSGDLVFSCVVVLVVVTAALRFVFIFVAILEARMPPSGSDDAASCCWAAAPIARERRNGTVFIFLKYILCLLLCLCVDAKIAIVSIGLLRLNIMISVNGVEL